VSEERFDPARAFARNIGWLTPEEQALLATRRVAIAGLGGVGGSHLLTLVRLGVGAFTLADPDVFEPENLNRQAAAYLDTLGRNKAEAAAEMARRINPRLDLRVLPEAVGPDNVDRFLEGADLFLDGLDFFALEARLCVFGRCRALGIPAVTAAPLGTSTAVLCFLPDGMPFDGYFGLAGRPPEEQALRFLIGLAPRMIHRRGLVWPEAVDLAARRGPSTSIGVELCAGAAAAEALKLLLGRGGVRGAPHGWQFDAQQARLVRTWRPGGHRNPLTRLTLAYARRELARLRRAARGAGAGEKPLPPGLDTPAGRTLDLARWAPSGDNTQPWRFRLRGPETFEVRFHEPGEPNIYDLERAGAFVSFGALLESVRLAATLHGREAEERLVVEGDPPVPNAVVRLTETPDTRADPLAPWLPLRVTQRRAMGRRPLAAREKAALESAAAGEGWEVRWMEGGERLRMAWLVFRAARVRYVLRETWAVHREVIAWGEAYSEDRIPEPAVGFDPLTALLSRWAVRRWERVRFLNRFLAGTLTPRLELDLLPGLRCAGFAVLLAPRPPEGPRDWIEAGRRIQRLWLTATRLGLQMQPQFTPIVFARYARLGIPFTTNAGALADARRTAEALERCLGAEAAMRLVWLARIGAARPVRSRSGRLPLARLTEAQSQKEATPDRPAKPLDPGREGRY